MAAHQIKINTKRGAIYLVQIPQNTFKHGFDNTESRIYFNKRIYENPHNTEKIVMRYIYVKNVPFEDRSHTESLGFLNKIKTEDFLNLLLSNSDIITDSHLKDLNSIKFQFANMPIPISIEALLEEVGFKYIYPEQIMVITQVN